MMVAKDYSRWCFLALATLSGARAIEWGSSTFSSTYDDIPQVEIGEIHTIVIEPGERASIDFIADPTDYFAVSFRQCSDQTPQPLQLQYGTKLNYLPFFGGCIHAGNEIAADADLGDTGCTFWQYNPGETYSVSGEIFPNKKAFEPGRARFENQGTANATVEVVMFSSDVPPPAGLVNSKVWIEDGYNKKDGVLNTTVNVYFNNDANYCDAYGCTVSGWLNDYVEGQDSLSLCQIRENGTAVYTDEQFKTYIPMTFELPETGDYYVTLIVEATASDSANYTIMQEYGLGEVVVFQTDTTQADNSARVMAGLSLLTLTWVMLLNTIFTSLGSSAADDDGRHGAVPTLGW